METNRAELDFDKMAASGSDYEISDSEPHRLRAAQAVEPTDEVESKLREMGSGSDDVSTWVKVPVVRKVDEGLGLDLGDLYNKQLKEWERVVICSNGDLERDPRNLKSCEKSSDFDLVDCLAKFYKNCSTQLGIEQKEVRRLKERVIRLELALKRKRGRA